MFTLVLNKKYSWYISGRGLHCRAPSSPASIDCHLSGALGWSSSSRRQSATTTPIPADAEPRLGNHCLRVEAEAVLPATSRRLTHFIEPPTPDVLSSINRSFDSIDCIAPLSGR